MPGPMPKTYLVADESPERHSRPGSRTPATKTAHGRNPPRSPPRVSVSSVDATIIPSIGDGVSAATPLPA
jgi:hypothetical protein